jgi:hypothetical protein
MENPMQTAFKTEELFKLIPVRTGNSVSPSGDVYSYRYPLNETLSVNNLTTYWDKYKWYFVAGGIIAGIICLAIYYERKKTKKDDMVID